MSQVITNRIRTSRRALLKGMTLAGARITVGLPPLVSMFNSLGTAYAAEIAPKPIETRFVLWFNGNGIPERYWIPTEEGPITKSRRVWRRSHPGAKTFTC